MGEYTLFESYLSDNLSAEDRQAFEEKLKSDDALNAAFDEHVKTQAALDILQEEDIMNVIDTIKVEEAAKAQGSKFSKSIFAIAAMIALMIVAGNFFLNKSAADELGTEQLIAGLYNEPMSSATRSLEGDSPTRIEILNTKATVLFQSKEYDKAAVKYREIIAEGEGIEVVQAEWNLILCLLDSDRTQIIPMLEKILTDSNHIRYEKAKRLHTLLTSKSN